jgi:hypothetical protein
MSATFEDRDDDFIPVQSSRTLSFPCSQVGQQYLGVVQAAAKQLKRDEYIMNAVAEQFLMLAARLEQPVFAVPPPPKVHLQAWNGGEWPAKRHKPDERWAVRDGECR